MSVQIVSFLVGSVLLACSHASASSDWYVDQRNCPGGTGSPTDPFCTVQQALTAASSGDRIWIAPGVYPEAMSISIDVTVTGSSDGAVVLDGTGLIRLVEIQPGCSVEMSLIRMQNCSGPAVYNEGTLELHYCEIAENHSHGLFNNGTVHMVSCSVTDNEVVGYADPWGFAFGGGIYNVKRLTMEGCSVLRNQAVGKWVPYGRGCTCEGGGIFNAGVLSLSNCLVAENYAFGTYAYGGGICDILGVSTTLWNTTIAYNDIYTWDLFYGEWLGSGIFARSTVSLGNCIIAHNEWGDIEGTVQSLGYNLVSDDTGVYFQGDETGNQYKVDPLFSDLSRHGGPVLNLGLQPGSPAIDAGNPDFATCPPVDIRNFGRALSDPSRGICDIGSFETGAEPEFRLACTPDDVALGGPLWITSTFGWPLQPFFLFVVEVNGTPRFQLVDHAPLDARGVYFLDTTAPSDPALSGLQILLRGYSFSPRGLTTKTNDAPLAFH